MSRAVTFACWLFALCAAHAYDFIRTRPLRWRDGNIVMRLQLDATMTPRALLDGHSSWNDVAVEAFAIWNSEIGHVQFAPVVESTHSGGNRDDGNDENDVFFSPDVYGQSLGDLVLAVTTTWHIGSQRVEGDTIFNTEIDWDSYRGDLAFGAVDLRRVAVHEFGHTLGLDHPDEAGQVQVAVMNGIVSDLDNISRDDIRGARALYLSDMRFSLNLATNGSGRIIVMPQPGEDGKYQAGRIVTLFAKARRHNRFASWAGDRNQTGRRMKLRILADENITANFRTNGAPVVLSSPRSQFASGGDQAFFRVRVSSRTTAHYQWQLNGGDIFDATNSTLALGINGHEDSGLYSCRIMNARGSTISRAARLVVDGY
jgi:hypothetical protein